MLTSGCGFSLAYFSSNSWLSFQSSACDQPIGRHLVRSVWMIGERAESELPYASGPALWDLLAFGGAADLWRVRLATQLHRQDVRLRIVTDGDRFGTAWGDSPAHGSLHQWDWVRAGEREAFYSEVRWREPAREGLVERMRRRALCLWQAGAP